MEKIIIGLIITSAVIYLAYTLKKSLNQENCSTCDYNCANCPSKKNNTHSAIT